MRCFDQKRVSGAAAENAAAGAVEPDIGTRANRKPRLLNSANSAGHKQAALQRSLNLRVAHVGKNGRRGGDGRERNGRQMPREHFRDATCGRQSLFRAAGGLRRE